jgi:hypothetical protein
MLDEEEFLSPYGIRSVSRWHEQHPYVVRVGGKEYQVSIGKEISDRLQRIFLRNETGRRPVFGGTEKFQKDPHWRDCNGPVDARAVVESGRDGILAVHGSINRASGPETVSL